MMIKTRRPKLELLSSEFVEKIVDEAYNLLETHGILIENEEAVELLADGGMRNGGDGHSVRLTRSLVEDCLRSAPSSITLYDRAGEKAHVVGGDDIHFNPGSTAVTLLDHASQVERKADSSDLVRLYRLVESLEHIHFQSTALVSSDVPHAVSDCYRLYLGLQCSTKPFITGTFRVDGFKPMRDLLVAVRGSGEELARKPLAVFDACPSPPLRWSRLTSQSLIDAARAGIPSELISMGMTGATSPVTIAGTLVQHVAENLCGLSICQLARRGAPVIFGGSPSSFDMRKGTTPMGAVETMMIDSAYAQIGKFLRLPTHAYMCLSDAKVIDAQAGLETGIGAVLAALSGINVISGPGMLDFESAQSLEKLVIDNDICGMAYRLVEGIAQREEILAIDKFEALTDAAQFLSLPHTRKWYRTEHTFQKLLDRDTYEAWAGQGRQSMAERASGEVRRRLSDFPTPALDEKTRGDLDRIMRDYARSNGLDSLPEIPSI